MFESHVRRHILYEQPRSECVLGNAHLVREQFDGFFRVWQREQVIEELTAGMTPAGVLGNERGFKAGDGMFYAGEMLAIDAVGGSERKADTMQTQWIDSPGTLERAHRGATFVKIIFRVRFDPADGRTLVDEGVMVNGPKTDPGTCRNRSRPHTS
jgi:hypothetical protein